jgi:hypothetical protein
LSSIAVAVVMVRGDTGDIHIVKYVSIHAAANVVSRQCVAG